MLSTFISAPASDKRDCEVCGMALGGYLYYPGTNICKDCWLDGPKDTYNYEDENDPENLKKDTFNDSDIIIEKPKAKKAKSKILLYPKDIIAKLNQYRKDLKLPELVRGGISQKLAHDYILNKSYYELSYGQYEMVKAVAGIPNTYIAVYFLQNPIEYTSTEELFSQMPAVLDKNYTELGVGYCEEGVFLCLKQG